MHHPLVSSPVQGKISQALALFPGTALLRCQREAAAHHSCRDGASPLGALICLQTALYVRVT
jgi:hypothetical protein